MSCKIDRVGPSTEHGSQFLRDTSIESLGFAGAEDVRLEATPDPLSYIS